MDKLKKTTEGEGGAFSKVRIERKGGAGMEGIKFNKA